MMVGGVCALLEKDIKKVVAFSTISQLGFIVFCLGFCPIIVGFGHLIFHAFFKSVLFCVVGRIIFISSHNQNSVKFSFICSKFCLLLLFTSLIAMCGFMFLSGFFSKHYIVGFLWGGGGVSTVVFAVGLVLTVLYSSRFFWFSVRVNRYRIVIGIRKGFLVGGAVFLLVGKGVFMYVESYSILYSIIRFVVLLVGRVGVVNIVEMGFIRSIMFVGGERFIGGRNIIY